MKILFLTDNFPPEVNAPASRTYEHCREWVKQGVSVTVITGVPNFPRGKVFDGYINKPYQKEVIDGIEVIRVWTYVAENKGYFKRILDYLSFMLSSFFVGLFFKADIIIATSPQFFTAISGRWLSFWKRKPWVMEVRDLWPESIKAVGAIDKGLVIRFFEFLEKSMYRNASRIIVVTDSFKDKLVLEHNIPEERINVIKNGVNTDLFQKQDKNINLSRELGLDNKFVIGYIGTHGMAHALDFILRCAEGISDEDIHFLFLGDGAQKKELLRLRDDLELKNVTMLSSVGKHEVPRYISIIDIALVNLKKTDAFKQVIPSKIFELCAMQKPILLGVEGEAREIIERYNVGQAFEPENQKEFLRALKIIQHKSFPKERFIKIAKDFNRSKLAINMLSRLKNL